MQAAVPRIWRDDPLKSRAAHANAFDPKTVPGRLLSLSPHWPVFSIGAVRCRDLNE